MSSIDHKRKIVEYIKSVKPRSAGHKLLSQDEYLDGVIAQVAYTDSQEDIKQWVIVTKKTLWLC